MKKDFVVGVYCEYTGWQGFFFLLNGTTYLKISQFYLSKKIFAETNIDNQHIQ
jgi:hypothetical protein